MNNVCLKISFLFFLLFTNSAIASVTIFTDRTLWEYAAATKGSIQVDDFESYPVSAVTYGSGPGQLNIGETAFNDFSVFTSAYDGCYEDEYGNCYPSAPTNYNALISATIHLGPDMSGNHLILNHDTPQFDTVTTDKISFHEGIYALGFDIYNAAYNGGMIFSIPAEVNPCPFGNNSICEVLGIPTGHPQEDLVVSSILGNPGTGFIGIVADYDFTDIIFDIEGVPFNNEYFSVDNISYVSAVPIPAAAWLFVSALVGLVGFKRKK